MGTDENGKSGRPPAKRFTREELIGLILKRQEELGRPPCRKDMPEGTLAAYKSEVGKWVYALEAAGVRKPSATTIQRRRNRKIRQRAVSGKKKRTMDAVQKQAPENIKDDPLEEE